ncbi:acyltransferase [Kitasatospora mediocidica]|uniref:acyltransferase n=1 Tax=Kitasatospora mediocidica TaxID=58352 RepID=UPI0005612CED|nr:acyltransferase [Kitasatospora mediocidica]
MVSAWPQSISSRTVRAGRAAGTVVRCGLMDTMLADLPVSVVFFFPQALDEERLALGLARALEHLPVFAGRLRTAGRGLEIVCDDAGVPLTCGDVDETAVEAMGRVTLPASGLVDHVDATGARAGGQPLLTVRLSRLADGGTALGCSWHHAVGDVQSFMVLMRAWSAAVEGLPLPPVRIAGDRDALLDEVLPPEDCGRAGFRLTGPAEAAELMREVAVSARANRTTQVYFGPAEVARMRAEFSAAAGRRLSANDALCAHLVDTVRTLDEDAEVRRLTMPVNVRRFLDLPAGVVGNLLGEVFLSCPPAGTPERLAADIRVAVDGFMGAHLSLRSNRAFLAAIGPDRLEACVPLGFDPANRTFTFSNWSRFGAYEITFEGQRPTFFSPLVNLQLPWVSWLVEGFGGEGALFTVVLPTRLAGRLRAEAGRAALHCFRAADDPLPAVAGEVRKLL